MTLNELEDFYGSFISKLHLVSSVETAELSKLYENVYRAINIGLANEFKLLCLKINVDPFEVINAAKTKPFGFQAFMPGPGVGGHCIPIDPQYLSWASKKQNYDFKLIEISQSINNSMPSFVVSRAKKILEEMLKPLSESRILITGLSIKKILKT